MEKTWEVKEKELREQIVKDVITFLENNEWYDDIQLSAIIMGNKWN